MSTKHIFSFSRSFKIITISLLAIFLSFEALSQEIRTWKQTSVSDFSGNIFINTIVTNNFNGEVRLQYPVVRTKPDSINNTYPRFVAYDSTGNYVRTWRVQDTVFAQRYDSSASPSGIRLRVSESGKGITSATEIIACTMMNNGYFYVSWWSVDNYKIYGQLFDNQDQKVGPNITFNPFNTSWKSDPTVFSKPSDSTFWLIMAYRMAPGVDSTVLMYWRINLLGDIIDGPKRLLSNHRNSFERNPFACWTPSGDFLVTWYGKNDLIGGREDTLYVQRFTAKGIPIGEPKMVSDKPGWGVNRPFISVDKSGRYVIVWGDNRNYNLGSIYFDVFAQVFDANDRLVDKNFWVNTPIGSSQRQACAPVARFRNERFEVSWTMYNSSTGFTDIYFNEWKLNLELEGVCISSAHDAGPLIQSYDTINWNAVVPSGTDIKFQIRSAASLSALDTASWYGPSGIDDYYTVSGAAIHPHHNQHRYIQYKAFFSSMLWGITPELQDISINYIISPTLPPLPPTNLSTVSNSSQVRLFWQHSPSAKVYRYKLYRGSSSRIYDSLWTKYLPPSQLQYRDTTVRNGNKYFYAVTASDSNLMESQFSNEAIGTPLGIRIYVSESAPPNGNGTQDFPFNTIGEALSVATWGDTTLVLPGVYQELVRMKKGVSIIGSGPRVTRIQSRAAGDTATVIWGADSATIRGFTIALTRITTSWSDPIVAYPGSPIVTDNVIINEISPGNRNGVYARNANVFFHRNYVVGFNIGFFCFDASSSDIRNNVIVGVTGVKVNGPNVSPKIINNTIVSSGNGIYIVTNINIYADIRNNNLVGAQGSTNSVGINLGNGTLPVDYNNVWRFTYPYQGSITGLGNISDDPKFVNEARADYRLRHDSPCRDAGDPSLVYNDPDGTRNDIGAFGGPSPIDPTIFPGIPIIFGTNNATGFPGDTVLIAVSISNAARFSRGEFSVNYDAGFVRLIAVNRTALTQNFQMLADTTVLGRCRLNLYYLGEIGSGSGDLIQMSFRISPLAVPGQATALTVSAVNLRDSLDDVILIQQICNGTIVLNPGSGIGRYVYVDKNHTGPEFGTRTHPFKTIQAGINFALHGDTVVVAAGLYQEYLKMRDSIHLMGSGPGVTSVKGEGTSPTGYDPTVNFFRVKDCSIRGFTIFSAPHLLGANIICDSSRVSVYQNRIVSISPYSLFKMIEVRSGSDLQLYDNFIYGENVVDRFIRVKRSKVKITRNAFGKILDRGGISLEEKSRAVIGNNKIMFDGVVSGGIDVNGCTNVLIHNNLLLGGNTLSTAIVVRTSDSIEIVNNTSDTRYRGIDVANSVANVRNNIVTGNMNYGVSVGGGSNIMYNDIWGNGINYSNTIPGTGDISEDPFFVDRGRQDYRLLFQSPCKDAGDPNPIYNDLDGTRSDMGLYGGPIIDTMMFPLSGASVQVSSKGVVAGDTFSLFLTTTLVKDLASATIQLSYNPLMLNYIGARTSTTASGFSLSYAYLGSGVIQIVLSGTQSLTIDSAKIVEIIFIASSVIGQTTVGVQHAVLISGTQVRLPVNYVVNGEVNIGTTESKEEVCLPSVFSLYQNYPNPFNPITIIKYQLPVASKVEVKIYNILGQEVKTLVDEIQDAGYKSVEWHSTNNFEKNVASGVYFYRIEATSTTDPSKSFTHVRKMLLLR